MQERRTIRSLTRTESEELIAFLDKSAAFKQMQELAQVKYKYFINKIMYLENFNDVYNTLCTFKSSPNNLQRTLHLRKTDIPDPFHQQVEKLKKSIKEYCLDKPFAISTPHNSPQSSK